METFERTSMKEHSFEKEQKPG